MLHLNGKTSAEHVSEPLILAYLAQTYTAIPHSSKLRLTGTVCSKICQSC